MDAGPAPYLRMAMSPALVLTLIVRLSIPALTTMGSASGVSAYGRRNEARLQGCLLGAGRPLPHNGSDLGAIAADWNHGRSGPRVQFVRVAQFALRGKNARAVCVREVME
jgi:hypothetical protein